MLNATHYPKPRLGALLLITGLVSACGAGPDSRPSPVSSSSSAPSSSSSSSKSASASSSSSKSSSSALSNNRIPEAKMTISTQGLSVHVDGLASTDPDKDSLTHLIDYGDGSSIRYADAWHTYAQAGTYTVRLGVSDGKLTSEKVEIVTVKAAGGNHPPVARMASFKEMLSPSWGPRIASYGTLSYDEDKDPLTYTWDAAGVISQQANSKVKLDCDTKFSGSSSSGANSTNGAIEQLIKPDQLVTLTVSDGKVSDTIQKIIPYDYCPSQVLFLITADDTSRPNFTYVTDGLTVHLDARSSSYNTVALSWNFGDGTGDGNYWLTSHTYSKPGTYKIALRNTTQEPSFFNVQPKEISVTVSDNR